MIEPSSGCATKEQDIKGTEKVREEMQNQKDQKDSFTMHERSDANRVSGRPPFAVIALLVATFVAFAGIFAYGMFARAAREKESDAMEQIKIATPSYIVSPVKIAAKTVELKLPANIQAIQEFSIYSRCDGYLKRRLVDIGDHVRKGQLLVEIDAPELEKQLKREVADYKQAEAQVKSAEADLAQAMSMVQNNKAAVKRLEAQIHFSALEVQRYKDLERQGAVSSEQRDEKVRDVSTDRASLEAAQAAVAAAKAQAAAYREKITAARANVDAANASVEELETTTAFQKVLAPCDGVITARNVDAGALVSKGSSTNNQELLKMARTDMLRVFVYIPQTDYQGVTVGMPAKITVAELPNQAFDARITHISGGLDPTSRTLLAEIQIPNTNRKLMPGMFAQVRMIAQRQHPPVIAPDSAIVVKPEGQFVVVYDNGSVHYQKVTLGRDFGKHCEVTGGLQPGDQVLLQPTTDLTEGQKINPDFVQAGPAKS